MVKLVFGGYIRAICDTIGFSGIVYTSNIVDIKYIYIWAENVTV